jgi:3-oxoacyl-[acyl-carrier-protein] synthase II
MTALNASGSLATRYNDDPARASRPFDKGRDGNVLGEGAAGILLESESHARARRARIYAYMVGYQICAAGQNRQYSHDDPEIDTRPCTRALRGVLREARWRPEDVDLVNANGSSSILYDRLEGKALGEVFGDALPDTRVHSIKSMLGQHGAGSSALQVATACLSIRRQVAPPTINHEEPDPTCGPLRVVTKAEECSPQRVLIHAIGLGGFYYSWAAFQAPSPFDDLEASGKAKVVWSEGGHAKFRPTARFERPLKPWRPRSD